MDDLDVTPVIPSGFNERYSALEVRKRVPHARSALDRLVDIVFARRSWLANLTPEQVLKGAFTPAESAEHKRIERDYQSALRDFLARAGGYVGILGEGYRRRIYAAAVKEAVNAKR